jgi:hypothetical protein
MSWNFKDLSPALQRRINADGMSQILGQTPKTMPTIYKKKGIMNELERNFHLSYLQPREQAGELTLIRYEGITLPIAHRCTYTPDYIAETPEGQTVLFETKSPHRFKEKGILKLKVAAAQYPEYQFYLAEKKKGQWKVKLIPTWSRTNLSTDPEDEEIE